MPKISGAARRVLGLIPARGGSKGVKNKNIRPLNGKPLIGYTIESAQASRLVGDLLVTTDSEAIARTAGNFGVDVLMRPSNLARDGTPMAPVALHALDQLKARGKEFDFVLLLQPTCPFRTADDIDGALSMALKRNADAVIGVYRVYDEHPARMYHLRKGVLVPYDSRWEKRNRQDLPPVYHRNGLIYLVREKVLRAKMTFFPPNSRPFLMPKERSVNIDEESDFAYAEFLLTRAHASNS